MRHILLVIGLALAACAATPTVRFDRDPTADLSRYRTYSWAYQAMPPGGNQLVLNRVKSSIDRQLAARGYTETASGDFAIGFTLGARDKVEVSNMGAYQGFYPGYGFGYRRGWAFAYDPVQVRNIREGMLAIDIYDAASKRPVWHGLATQEVGRDGASDKVIDGAVAALLANFAPPPKP